MLDFVLPVKYSFSISDRETLINNEEIKESLNKYSKYCKDSKIIDLTEITTDETSKKQDYEFAARSQKASYEQQIKPLQKQDEVSNYAIAPQLLLIYLGSLFSDIANVQIQQLPREPRILYLNNEKNELNII